MKPKNNFNNRLIVINEPKHPTPFSVYRVTIASSNGHKTYVGHTGESIHRRAYRHATMEGRNVYDAFHADPKSLMIVEHVTGARTRKHARELEQHHIQREHKRVGNNLLNVHHTKKK